ncbi:MAG: hypothetical protein R6U43_01465 [Candidatus Krumholzibacteriales bacterium]
MKKIIYLIPLIVLITCFNNAAAQYSDREKTETALRWTEQIIEQAREAVRNSRSLKARVTLEKAVELQKRARERAGDFSSKAANLAAYNFTRAARDEAKHAIALARTENRLAEKARRLFERTGERLSSLNRSVTESGIRDMRIQKFILDARSILEKAHTNYSQMNNRSALKLAEKANSLAEHADRRFRRLNQLRNTCRRRINILERLTGRASRFVENNGDQQSRKQLATAARQLERARDHFREGRYQACSSSISQSEKLMRGLIRRIHPSEEQGFESALDRAWLRLEMAEEKNEDSRAGIRLLNRARQMLEEAEDNYQNGRLENARRLLERSMEMIRNTGQKELSEEQLYGELRKLEARNEMMKGLVNRCGTEESRTLYQRALEHMNRARALIGEGKLNAAFSEIQLTRNIFNRISEIC